KIRQDKWKMVEKSICRMSPYLWEYMAEAEVCLLTEDEGAATTVMQRPWLS
ncbi:hypothetical protein PISMIDRAFT_675496, partial [Pisolithus microcarpus 441]